MGTVRLRHPSGIPFIAFTLHAAMTQIPDEVMEAAAIDGAGPWQRFRDVTWPGIKPIFIVLLALSTMWDLRVFTQVFVLQQAGGISHDTNLLGTWAYREAVASNKFGTGAAIALVLNLIQIAKVPASSVIGIGIDAFVLWALTQNAQYFTA